MRTVLPYPAESSLPREAIFIFDTKVKKRPINQFLHRCGIGFLWRENQLIVVTATSRYWLHNAIFALAYQQRNRALSRTLNKVLKIRRVQPTLLKYDLPGVQPMSGPTGMIFSMRSRLD